MATGATYKVTFPSGKTRTLNLNDRLTITNTFYMGYNENSAFGNYYLVNPDYVNSSGTHCIRVNSTELSTSKSSAKTFYYRGYFASTGTHAITPYNGDTSDEQWFITHATFTSVIYPNLFPAKPTKGTATVSNIKQTTATISWSGFKAASGAIIAKYQISTNATSWTDVSGTSTNLTGLSANTSYTRYIRAVDDYGTASDYVSATFKTLPNVPTAGTVTAGSITYKSAKLTFSGFNASTGATISKYQYSTNKSTWKDTTATSVTLSSLSPNTSYTYYVRVVDNYSQTSATVSVKFTTSKPAKPTAGTVSVSDITPFGAVISWSGFSISAGASSYKYQYYINSWIDLTTSTRLELSNLTPETTYKVYIRMVDNYGTASSSATVTFTTLVDQLKVDINVDGVIKKARVFYNDNGSIKKVIDFKVG